MVKAPSGGALTSVKGGLAPPGSDGKIQIRGGTFEGDNINYGYGAPFLQIYGGTFSTNPSKYSGKNHAVFGTADGKYTVKPQAEAAAKITSGSLDAHYSNLSDALSTVKDGDTLTLLKDYSGPVTLLADSN